MSRTREYKTDGSHCGTSKLKTYNSYVGNTSTRLEIHDCITSLVKIENHTVGYVLKLDRPELLTIREVFKYVV